jgi:hypothetical protein
MAYTLFAMASGKVFQSKKVGQTLQDLEAAFADWEALSDTPMADDQAAQQGAQGTQQSAHQSAHQQDVREKTKKLLNQLREQLAELAE